MGFQGGPGSLSAVVLHSCQESHTWGNFHSKPFLEMWQHFGGRRGSGTKLRLLCKHPPDSYSTVFLWPPPPLVPYWSPLWPIRPFLAPSCLAASVTPVFWYTFGRRSGPPFALSGAPHLPWGSRARLGSYLILSPGTLYNPSGSPLIFPSGATHLPAKTSPGVLSLPPPSLSLSPLPRDSHFPLELCTPTGLP